MKQVWSLLLLSFTGIGLVFNLHAQELPKTQIRNLNTGKKVAFNKAIEKGKPTLISFWATWCAHGKRQVKTIFRKMPEWKKQADFDYVAIAVDQHDEDIARTYARAQGWNFPCYIDPNSDLKPSLGFKAMPFIVIH